MSKKNDSQVAVREAFAVDMPDNAPALGFDPHAASFSWQDVLPDNYWNEDNVKAKRDALGGWPVLTPKQVVIRPVIDPEEKEPDLTPKIVMYFEEAGPALVFNKSRCQIAQTITGTPNPAHWVERMGPIVLMWGDYNKRLQLVFEQAPRPAKRATGAVADLEDEQLNDALFN